MKRCSHKYGHVRHDQYHYEASVNWSLRHWKFSKFLLTRPTYQEVWLVTRCCQGVLRIAFHLALSNSCPMLLPAIQKFGRHLPTTSVSTDLFSKAKGCTDWGSSYPLYPVRGSFYLLSCFIFALFGLCRFASYNFRPRLARDPPPGAPSVRRLGLSFPDLLPGRPKHGHIPKRRSPVLPSHHQV